MTAQSEIADLFAALADIQDAEPEPEPAPPRAGAFYASTITDPERLAGAALAALHEGQRSINPETGERHVGVDVSALVGALRESARLALAPGAGTEMAERRLLASAALLENLIVVWTTNAVRADSIEKLGLYGQLLLKGQNQLRRTLVSLAEIRNPRRTTFVRQQNQAINQQILNSPVAGKIEKVLDFPASELLEGNEHVDFRAAPLAIENDASLETLGALNRPANSRGEIPDENERMEAWHEVGGNEGG